MSRFKIILVGVGVLFFVGGLIFSRFGRGESGPANNAVSPTPDLEADPETASRLESGSSILGSGQAGTKNLLINKNTMPNVKIQTNKGEITIELFSNDAPKTAENFLTLAKKGFYDGVIFHRVISGFMIQGGDPTGTGRGGPSYKFADELDASTPSYQRGYVRGTVAMANSGPNTNGSQFFIIHQDYPLPNLYTIFGRVTSGMEVVDAIASGPTDSYDRPLTEVVMNKVTAE